MSLIRTKEGVVIGTGSGSLFVDRGGSLAVARSTKASSEAVDDKVTKKFENPLPSQLFQMGNVAMWGTNNLLPQDMATDIESTAVLSAGTESKARIAVGKGPSLAKKVGIDNNGQEIIEFVRNPEIEDWMEACNYMNYSYNTALDLYRLGNGFSQVLLNKGRNKILAFKRQDPCECRFSVKDENSLKSEYVFMSGDWRLYATPGWQNDPKNKHVAVVPLLDKDFPLLDLRQRSSGGSFMLALQYPLYNRHYYAPSPWYCAKQWVDISKGIPEMKDAMFQNQMNIKYVVSIHPEFWKSLDQKFDQADDDGKKKIKEGFYDQVDQYLVGGKNSFKSIFATRVWDNASNTVVDGITITPLDDKIKDGKLLPDSAAADSQILFALSMNPALVGLSIPGSGTPVSAGSGSNIREAFLVQLMMMVIDQNMMSACFNLAKGFNKWDRDYVLRYPNTILTTLNTGAATAPTT